MQMQSKLCKRDDGGFSLPQDIISVSEVLLIRVPAKALRQCAGSGACARPGVPSSPSRPSSPHGDPAAAPAPSSSPCVRIRTRARAAPARPGRRPQGVRRQGPSIAGADAAQPHLRRKLNLIFVDRMELGAMIIHPASGRDLTVVDTNYPPRPLMASGCNGEGKAGKIIAFPTTAFMESAADHSHSIGPTIAMIGLLTMKSVVEGPFHLAHMVVADHQRSPSN
ncbi:unnamed protein product [Miscanthus lutarioriparius]|uniref:Uncharacterized protein n=1 Tax=Miscanthus lutarioriparius TaxID=422564 RepID=A0A811PH81_9POAL|nr:unnamed protein product [Miscanthus lutarioriparius]